MNSQKNWTHYHHHHHTLSLWAPQCHKFSVTNSDKVLVGPLKCSLWSPSLIGQEKRGIIISGALLWGIWWWCKVTGLSNVVFFKKTLELSVKYPKLGLLFCIKWEVNLKTVSPHEGNQRKEEGIKLVISLNLVFRGVWSPVLDSAYLSGLLVLFIKSKLPCRQNNIPPIFWTDTKLPSFGKGTQLFHSPCGDTEIRDETGITGSN
jgi:hypothetical protein